ncbi:hypothetical protein ACFO0S_01655 [Chryseomicrobium palamuruense]|uniref:Group-specific protein n=1 Tax=Chryseomicrobium palamuruense TaxID=682973 RepID=A0ABV8UTI5_9BACL
MKPMELTSLDVDRGYVNFLFPFAFHEKNRQNLVDELKREGYTFFCLDKTEMEDAFYGQEIKVHHAELEQFFFPFIEDKLFPTEPHNNVFSRFSRPFEEHGELLVDGTTTPFHLHSLDITLCPFGIGILTIRLEVDTSTKLHHILNFIHHFRVVEAKLEEEKGAIIRTVDRTFNSTNEYLFEHMIPCLQPFILREHRLPGYFGTLPYFEDERMYSSAFLFASPGQELTNDQIYRLGQLDGINLKGEPFISSTSPDYVDRFLKRHVNDRAAPYTYTVTSEYTHSTVTVCSPEDMQEELRQFMSTHYYNLLLHYFYRIMLLRLSFEHSNVSWKKDEAYVEELIEMISKFSARYYFGEVAVRTTGKENAKTFVDIFHLDDTFQEVRDTLQELYRTQENKADKQQNYLLFMLTTFTVISGIYGMNLVIEDWKGFTDWGKAPGYSFFEWVALIIALTGIGLSFLLILTTLGSTIKKKYRRFKRSQF